MNEQQLIELIAEIIAGIFVRANITADEVARLTKVASDLAVLRQHEQDIADGKIG